MQTRTLIEGLTDAMVQSRINQIDVKPYIYNSLFPLKKVNFFQWKTIENQIGPRVVAADVSADNASIIRKSRRNFQTAMGDIPLLTISREMRRSEIKEYQVAYALAESKDPASRELVDYWANDVDFCFEGIQAELEYIALKLISNAGTLSFTSQNNAAVATEFDLDYQVPSENKKTVSVPFTNPSTADFIGTVADAVKAGKAIGANIKYAYITLEELYRIQSMDQVIKACASFASNALNISQVPSLEAINSMLARQAHTNGVQLIVVDQTIYRELADGSLTSGNPFEDHRMVFTETTRLGSTQYCNVWNNNDTLSLRATRGHTTVKKYAQTEPYKEVTLAEADAIPVFDTAYKNIYVKTDGNDW